MFKGILGHSEYLSGNGIYSKQLSVERNGVTLGLGSSYFILCILGIFDCLVFKVSLGSFTCLKMACNSKLAGRRAKWGEI